MFFSRESSRDRTCVADTRVVNLNSDLVGLGRGDLDILDAQRLSSLPGNGGLASDGLLMGARANG